MRIGAAIVVALTGCGGVVMDAGSLGTGSVQAEVSLPAGLSVSTARYTLRDQTGIVRSATLIVAEGGQVVIGENMVPAQDGYTLDVIVASPDGTDICTASASFAVMAKRTTELALLAQCFDVGSIDVGITVVPAGVHFSSLRCTLKGPNGLDYMGVVNVNDQPAIHILLDNVPPGTGDTIACSAASTDGCQSCSASGQVDVVARQTTETSLALRCQPVRCAWTRDL
jgi:hypothetical protein